MPKRRTAPLPVIGDPNDPESLYAYLQRYLEWMRVRQYSEATLVNRTRYLRVFFNWCDDRGLGRPTDISLPIIERYQRYLFYYRKANGEPLSGRSQNAYLLPLRAYFKWLTKNHYILYNPSSDIELPRAETGLPRFILSQSEIEKVLKQAGSGHLGLRDRAILETFYSTGIRRMEMIKLNYHDLNQERETLTVRQGKGKKDRVIPIGRYALQWIRRYQDHSRPDLVSDQNQGALFLTIEGNAFTAARMSQLVSRYIQSANIGKRGSCHLFRHTMATLMLENGADIRFIQAMLGHSNISTTQIYTQVSIRKLKEIHTATHPGNREETTAELSDKDKS